MQNTTNYNMTIAEGSDPVNLLTQCYPNFNIIDGAMFANKQGSIGTATEVTTGTIHAITRSNSDANMFRFTATSAWTAGDTMTLDGVGVTVHLPDGTTPASGAYIIGAEVLCVVNGSLVTMFVGGAPQTYVETFNSRSGDVTPQASDYDGSMIDYDNTLSGLTSTDVQGAIDELASAEPTGGVTYDLLWTNPNPTADFAADTITLSESAANYDFLVIEYKNSKTSTYRGLFTVPTDAQCTLYFYSDVFYTRNITAISGTSVTIDDAKRIATYGAAGTVSNVALIPYKIYGMKI